MGRRDDAEPSPAGKLQSETLAGCRKRTVNNLGESKFRVLVVDDHPIVREGLRARISREEDIEVCGEADDLTTALAQVDQLKPDVIIVDLSLKASNGLDLIKQLTSRQQRPRIVVCSMHDEHIYAERAIDAGAQGYVHKQEATAQIVEAIRQVLSGRVYASEAVLQRLLTRAIGKRRTPEQASVSPVEQLTDREMEVFERLGTGGTIATIAAELKLSPKTVETYRDRIKQKLGVQNSQQLLHFAVRWVIEHNS
jgi:DNA-binding NarL/FixJ family response regulator